MVRIPVDGIPDTEKLQFCIKVKTEGTSASSKIRERISDYLYFEDKNKETAISRCGPDYLSQLRI